MPLLKYLLSNRLIKVNNSLMKTNEIENIMVPGLYDENDNCLASMNIEYCPMCGRKLYNTYLAIQHKSVKNCNKQYNSMDFHCYLNSVFAQTKSR